MSAPTTNSGAFNCQRIGITVNQDSSMAVVLSYTNASNSTGVVTRVITIPVSSSSPIVDQFGNVIAAGGTYSTLASAISSFLSSIDSSISSAASGGKLNL